MAAKQCRSILPPRATEDHIPVTLLEPIFAQFVDDCQNYRPTDEDNHFVQELSEQLCFFYPDKYSGIDVFKELLDCYGISAQCAMDERVSGESVAVIAKGRENFGNKGQRFPEAISFYHKFVQSLNGDAPLRSILPLFHIIVFRQLNTFYQREILNRCQLPEH